MFRNMLLTLLKPFWVLLLLGLGLLGFAGYTIFNAERGGSIPPEAELTPLTAQITEAEEVTLTTKHRNGDTSERKYYELTAQLADGTSQKWHVDHGIKQDVVETAIEETVQAKLDSNDNNLVYVLSANNQPLITYADMALIVKTEAEENRSLFATPFHLGFYSVLVVIGGLGMWLRRRMLRADSAAASTTAAATPGAGPST